MNKKGLTTFQIFLFIFLAFFVAIALGLMLFGSNLITETLGQDVEVGQVNLQNVTQDTIGRLNTAFFDNADTIGIVIILGMCLLMILNAYFLGGTTPKLFLIFDIFILVFAFILAVYVSQTYSLLINSTTYFNLFMTDLPKVSKFVLNLPLYLSTIGVLIMIITYSGIGRDVQKEVDVYGY